MNRSKNILIVTQNFLFGGLETQLVGQIEELKKFGWRVHLACGQEYSSRYVPSNIDSITHGVNFNYDLSVKDLLASVESLNEIIKKNSIHIIHAHPFISLIPSFIAAHQNNIPIFVTLHGPVSVKPNLGPSYDLINSVIISNSNLIAVSEETAELAKQLKSTIRPLILPNSVLVNQQKRTKELPDISKSRWLVASRLDGEKNTGIKEFIEISFAAGVRHIDIAGSGPAEDELVKWCVDNGYDKKVKLIGVVKDIPGIIKDYDACAGMGRFILEAIERKKPVCLVGYDGVKGIISSERRLKAASYRNFSGRNLKNITAVKFANQYKSFEDRQKLLLHEVIRADYSQKKVWKKFHHLVHAAKLADKTFLYDMYIQLRKNENYHGDTLLQSERIRNLATTLATAK